MIDRPPVTDAVGFTGERRSEGAVITKWKLKAYHELHQ